VDASLVFGALIRCAFDCCLELLRGIITIAFREILIWHRPSMPVELDPDLASSFVWYLNCAIA
jgi:hypothetical protein